MAHVWADAGPLSEKVYQEYPTQKAYLVDLTVHEQGGACHLIELSHAPINCTWLTIWRYSKPLPGRSGRNHLEWCPPGVSPSTRALGGWNSPWPLSDLLDLDSTGWGPGMWGHPGLSHKLITGPLSQCQFHTLRSRAGSRAPENALEKPLRTSFGAGHGLHRAIVAPLGHGLARDRRGEDLQMLWP